MRLSSSVGIFAQHVAKQMYRFQSEIRFTWVKADAKLYADFAARLTALKHLNLFQLIDYVASKPLLVLTTFYRG